MKICHWSLTSPEKVNTNNTVGMTFLLHGKVVTWKVT